MHPPPHPVPRLSKEWCTQVDGQRAIWEIEARDEVDVISKGTHGRFNAPVAKKAGTP